MRGMSSTVLRIRRHLLCGVFGEGQRSGGIAGVGDERYAEDASVRCDEGTEHLVASVCAGERQGSLVGHGQCSGESGISSLDGLGADAGISSDGRVPESFQGAGSGSIAGAGGTGDQGLI